MDELNYKDAYLALVRAVDDVIRYLEIPGQTADRHTVHAALVQALMESHRTVTFFLLFPCYNKGIRRGSK